MSSIKPIAAWDIIHYIYRYTQIMYPRAIGLFQTACRPVSKKVYKGNCFESVV